MRINHIIKYMFNLSSSYSSLGGGNMFNLSMKSILDKNFEASYGRGGRSILKWVKPSTGRWVLNLWAIQILNRHATLWTPTPLACRKCEWDTTSKVARRKVSENNNPDSTSSSCQTRGPSLATLCFKLSEPWLQLGLSLITWAWTWLDTS